MDARTISRRAWATLARDPERPAPERRALVRLMARLGALPPPPDPHGHFPEYERLHGRFLAALDGAPEALEERFLELYCHLHMYSAPYTTEERALVDAAGGYWCHAGGLSPILRAGPWLGAGSVSLDYGAGNGLQGLLLQLLYPHRRTLQVEISSAMVDIGRALQRWLGVAEERVEWRVADVRDVPPDGVDFVYLYRPLKPDGPGAEFYRELAAALDRADGPVTVFSVADALGPWLAPGFVRVADDGHLTCWHRPRGAPATPPTGDRPPAPPGALHRSRA